VKIVLAIRKLTELGMVMSKTEFMRNAIIKELIEITNTKEAIETIETIKMLSGQKQLTEDQEAKKYFKWLKNTGDGSADKLAKMLNGDSAGVGRLIVKRYDISLK